MPAELTSQQRQACALLDAFLDLVDARTAQNMSGNSNDEARRGVEVLILDTAGLSLVCRPYGTGTMVHLERSSSYTRGTSRSGECSEDGGGI